MIMIIVMSQFKLLECETSVCGCGTQVMKTLLQHFTNTLKWWLVVWSNSSTVVSIHCYVTLAVVHLLNATSKSSVWSDATYASWKCGVCDWIRTTVALLHNHRMRNAHMCTLAIVMATCSYGICFWQMGSNRL